MSGKTACIIGAGIGGLALAIRLQAAGVQTTVIEARRKAGGRAYYWQKDGFTFDGGPMMIADPAPLRELWALSGHDMDDDLELMEVRPNFRLNWPDGTTLDLADNREDLRAAIHRISPQDVAGYDAFCDHMRGLTQQISSPSASPPSGAFTWAKALVSAAPDLAQNRSWQSLYRTAARFISNEKLRQAFSFQIMLTGGNPATTSAMVAAHNDRNFGQSDEVGTYWVRGGIHRLVAGMARHFERLGGTVSLGDPVVKIDADDHRASAVHTKSGWSGSFDVIASNGDPVHTYRDLLGRNQHGWKMGKKMAKKRHGFSAFIVHFGVEGTWPGIPHHMALFGPRFEGLFTDIDEAGVLPQDMLITLHHPTITDPSMAPAGKSSFMAVIPVPHMGKLAVDWDLIGPQLEKRVLDEIGRRLIPDIYDRITTSFHYSPKQFAQDMGAHLGCAFGADPSFADGIKEANNRDPAIANFYMVGASTHPGSGMAGAVASAHNAAGQMLFDLKRGRKRKKPAKKKISKKKPVKKP